MFLVDLIRNIRWSSLEREVLNQPFVFKSEEQIGKVIKSCQAANTVQVSGLILEELKWRYFFGGKGEKILGKQIRVPDSWGSGSVGIIKSLEEAIEQKEIIPNNLIIAALTHPSNEVSKKFSNIPLVDVELVALLLRYKKWDPIVKRQLELSQGINTLYQERTIQAIDLTPYRLDIHNEEFADMITEINTRLSMGIP